MFQINSIIVFFFLHFYQHKFSTDHNWKPFMKHQMFINGISVNGISIEEEL